MSKYKRPINFFSGGGAGLGAGAGAGIGGALGTGIGAFLGSPQLGGAIGSGLGTLAGGLIGGLAGGDPAQVAAAKNSFNAQAPNLTQSDYASAIALAQQQALTGGGAQSAGQQDQLVAMLQAQAAGQGPSLAQRQLETATQQQQAQATGAIGSQRGLNPALAARMVLQNQAAQGQAAAGQSATTRLREQLGTQGMLAQALEQKRQQDIMQQQAYTNIYGAAGQLQQGQNALQQQGSLGAQGMNLSVAEQNAQLEQEARLANAGMTQQDVGAGLSAIGAVGTGLAAMTKPQTPTTEPAGYSYGWGGVGGVAHGGQVLRPGDHKSNDVVPAMLSPGEIVLPRSVTQTPDAPDRAAAFVAALKRNKKADGGKISLGEALSTKKSTEARLARLEAMLAAHQSAQQMAARPRAPAPMPMRSPVMAPRQMMPPMPIRQVAPLPPGVRG